MVQNLQVQSGITSTPQYVQDNQGTPIDSALSISTSKIGIGTSNPSKRLQIQGATRSLLFDVDDTYPRITFGGDSAIINWPSDKHLYFGETNYTGCFLIRGTKVGIGTTSPTEKLDVSGTVKATGFSVGSDPGVDATINYQKYPSGNGTLVFKKGLLVLAT